MKSKNSRALALLLLAVVSNLLTGCCSNYCDRCRIYEHPAPSCVGLHYEGCCTCKDDCRDRVNQITDILLP
ncbi:MAG: hypothetical protein JSS02_03515 [Planctomycetes bacterium]|nr:hypothetical protein [Planctomycetota bacterium]